MVRPVFETEEELFERVFPYPSDFDLMDLLDALEVRRVRSPWSLWSTRQRVEFVGEMGQRKKMWFVFRRWGVPAVWVHVVERLFGRRAEYVCGGCGLRWWLSHDLEAHYVEMHGE